MKRGGLLAFFIYLFNVIFSLCISLFSYITASNNPGMHNLVLVVVYMLSLAFMVPYIGLLVVKLLHFISGWKIFSFICMIGDLVLTLQFAFSAINVFTSGSIGEFLIFAIVIVLPPAIAFISEAASLGK